MARRAVALGLALIVPNVASWTPPACTSNLDCEGDVGPDDGDIIENTGVATLMWAAADTSNATYCAQLNGTKGCMPCVFYSLDSAADAAPAANATTDELAEFDGVTENNCYTANGWLSPADVLWFSVDPNEETATNIRDAGCGQCDARLLTGEQGGRAATGGRDGSICKMHSDCQENHYCDQLDFMLEDGTPAAGTCDEGRTTHFVDEDPDCNEPFDCALGTDGKAQCRGNALVCQSCGAAVDISLVHCHSMVPADLKNIWAKTSKPMRVIYGGLISCTLVYPIWCSVVFLLKNFTRCCGGAKYTWGM
jgi:hypothetical protein